MTSSVSVEKSINNELEAVCISSGSISKHYITVHPSTNGTFSMFKVLGEYLQKHSAKIITQFVFGGCSFYDDGIPEIEKQCGKISWPITWMQGDACPGKDLKGTQVCAVSGVDVQPIIMDGKLIGSVYEDDDAKYCVLGDLIPDDINNTPEEQTTDAFNKMDKALKLVGMDFSNVVRTWLYLDKLLTWYDEFNVARTAFFKKHGVFDRMVPASTGIGVSNPQGAALVCDLFAIQPKSKDIKVFAVPSPLQCAALDYKSSFSRAVEIDFATNRRLYISGTASIYPGGKTAHLDDSAKQIALTMEVVEGILHSRDMDWGDTTRAIGYFKDIADLPIFYKYCKDNNLPHIPMTVAHADVCRDDLLFEIELDAQKIK